MMNGIFHEIAVLIPAFEPDGALFELASSLEKLGFRHILVVDDGSASDFAREIFERTGKLDSVTLIRQEENLGKGAALKCGFEYILNELPFCRCVITADADGQHAPDDVYRMALESRRSPGRLILGVRDLGKKNVPFKSRIGNGFASLLIRVIRRIPLHDTQTGLRVLPVRLIPFLFYETGKSFDFEVQVLLCARKHGMDFCELPIRTLYFEDGRKSHFKPFRDSLKIFKAIFRS